MPEFLLPRVVRADYATAVRADIKQQEPCVCPRHWYFDVTIRCARCGCDVPFPADEQRFWYEQLHIHPHVTPKHCVSCRRELQKLKALRLNYDSKIAAALNDRNSINLKRELIATINGMASLGMKLPDRMRAKRRLLIKQCSRVNDIDAV